MTIYHLLQPGDRIQKYTDGFVYEITGTKIFQNEKMYTLKGGLLLPVKAEYVVVNKFPD